MNNQEKMESLADRLRGLFFGDRSHIALGGISYYEAAEDLGKKSKDTYFSVRFGGIEIGHSRYEADLKIEGDFERVRSFDLDTWLEEIDKAIVGLNGMVLVNGKKYHPWSESCDPKLEVTPKKDEDDMPF